MGRQVGDAARPAVRIEGLDRVDSLVLRSAGTEAVRDFGTRFTTAEFLASVTAGLSITEAEAIESLEVLDNFRVIKIHRTLGGGLSSMRTFDLTDAGLATYFRAYEREYPKVEATVIARLAEWPHDQGSEQGPQRRRRRATPHRSTHPRPLRHPRAAQGHQAGRRKLRRPFLRDLATAPPPGQLVTAEHAAEIGALSPARFGQAKPVSHQGRSSSTARQHRQGRTLCHLE